MGDTQGSPTISTKLQKIAKQAEDCPDLVFNNLYHLLDYDFLLEAYHCTRKDSAPGVDRVTAKQYAKNLEGNLHDLHGRLRNHSYKAPPVERVWIDKEGGKKRPIGKPTFEDKVVQRACVMLLSPIYDHDFYEFSHGFRTGHSQHGTLAELERRCWNTNINWVVDADVSGFFDNLDYAILREFIQKRVNDGGINRLIGKWLNAGVVEDGQRSRSKKGTPQGGVISPLLANIFLHYVLDEWFIKDVQPRMRGRCFLVRYADDFIIGFERKDDALRVMEVLPKRFGRFGLSIHPDKTKMVRFGRPPNGGMSEDNGTFDFLGFTYFWAKSRRGKWIIKKKTMGKRLNRFVKSIWQWCRFNRHEPLEKQHKMLCLKLRGHYQYYAVNHNSHSLHAARHHSWRTWRYWLSKRSGKGVISWSNFERVICKKFPLPHPRILHQI